MFFSELLLPDLNFLFVHGLAETDVHHLRFFRRRLCSVARVAALLGDSQRRWVLTWIANLALLLLIFVNRVVLVVFK